MSVTGTCRACGKPDVIQTFSRGGPQGIDACIAPIVGALNVSGIKTIASCCGHQNAPGNIALADGRELIIAPDFETARAVDRAFPDIHAEQQQ